MLTELNELRERLEAQSFQLGRSESAAGALHNVRNSLNPISVIISKALSEQSSVKAQDVEQAMKELASGDTEQGRRERLAAFLRAAFEDAQRRAGARREAFLSAKDSLAEALDILRSQNELGHEEIPFDHFDVLDVIKRNAALAKIAPWGEINLHLPSESMVVCANKLLTSQVIANLMTNAVESIVAADRRPGSLSVTCDQEAAGVSIAITDDGAGFVPEMAPKLFERGHSTKKSRSRGLGLHWCANTINAMGGSLSLASKGPGKGATATLVLPSGMVETTATQAAA
jgi:signal transduction histidine kinase